VDDVIPILHGERAFSHHHNSPGDVVIGTIYIRVPKSVAKIEFVTAFASFLGLSESISMFMSFIYFDNYCTLAKRHLHLLVQCLLQRRMLESPL